MKTTRWSPPGRPCRLRQLPHPEPSPAGEQVVFTPLQSNTRPPPSAHCHLGLLRVSPLLETWLQTKILHLPGNDCPPAVNTGLRSLGDHRRENLPGGRSLRLARQAVLSQPRSNLGCPWPPWASCLHLSLSTSVSAGLPARTPVTGSGPIFIQDGLILTTNICKGPIFK